ncbi:MAG: polyprenyl diphosphate synthase [Armatimonadota bacterium]
MRSYPELDMARIPEHIAVIMDGNGRWATRQGMKRLQGHFQGYKTLHNVVIWAADLGVRALTAYAFSSENWTRPETEVEGLMELVTMALQAELEMMMEEGVRIVRSGRGADLPAEVIEEFDLAEEQTKNNSKIALNICLNYGGRNEIVDAAKAAAKMVADGKISPEEIDEKLLSNLMYRPELSDPDLLIRTAGEMRVSNFLLWEIAYSEIYVTQSLWPDFSKDELVRAIAEYQSRTRKFGAVVDEK